MGILCTAGSRYLARSGYFVYSGVSILGQVWVSCVQRGLDTWPGLGILCTAGSRYLARACYVVYVEVSMIILSRSGYFVYEESGRFFSTGHFVY